jgi:hypothetical protein
LQVGVIALTHSAVGRGRVVSVGARVLVFPGTIYERRGAVVEDFGDFAGHSVVVDGNHIADAARRWAVQLDNGQLVFVDDHHITQQ